MPGGEVGTPGRAVPEGEGVDHEHPVGRQHPAGLGEGVPDGGAADRACGGDQSDATGTHGEGL